MQFWRGTLQNGVLLGRVGLHVEGRKPYLLPFRWPTACGGRPVRSSSADSILLTWASSTRRMTNRFSVFVRREIQCRSMDTPNRRSAPIGARATTAGPSGPFHIGSAPRE